MISHVYNSSSSFFLYFTIYQNNFIYSQYRHNLINIFLYDFQSYALLSSFSWLVRVGFLMSTPSHSVLLSPYFDITRCHCLYCIVYENTVQVGYWNLKIRVTLRDTVTTVRPDQQKLGPQDR